VDLDGCPLMPPEGVLPVDRQDVRRHDRTFFARRRRPGMLLDDPAQTNRVSGRGRATPSTSMSTFSL
jgi:hypothetical protein